MSTLENPSISRRCPADTSAGISRLHAPLRRQAHYYETEDCSSSGGRPGVLLRSGVYIHGETCRRAIRARPRRIRAKPTHQKTVERLPLHVHIYKYIKVGRYVHIYICIHIHIQNDYTAYTGIRICVNGSLCVAA